MNSTDALPRPSILIVDDEEHLCRAVEIALMTEGYDIRTVNSVRAAESALLKVCPDLLLTDVRLPDGDGLNLLRIARELDAGIQVIVMTAYATVETALESMRAGAFDYILKPFDPFELKTIIRNAIELRRLRLENDSLRRAMRKDDAIPGLIGGSEPMKKLFDMIRRVAAVDTTALVTGESGVGKEIVARAIHSNSSRSGGAFVTVNCGAISDTLLESELFGHAKGAFTGADRPRDGLFATAHSGTIFLDEIAEASQGVQVKLLRVIQEGEIRRVGDSTPVKVDVRVITATNRDLETLVREGKFREDLFYRLDVVRIVVPPLRDRMEDVIHLATRFAETYAEATGLPPKPFSAEAARILMAYDWPGNVRELENAVKKAMIFATGDDIGPEALPERILLKHALIKASRVQSSVVSVPGVSGQDAKPDAALFALSFKDAKKIWVDRFEVSYIKACLGNHFGVVTKASVHAGMDRGNFQKLMRKHGITSGFFRK